MKTILISFLITTSALATTNLSPTISDRFEQELKKISDWERIQSAPYDFEVKGVKERFKESLEAHRRINKELQEKQKREP